jgi:hypothetical protein
MEVTFRDFKTIMEQRNHDVDGLVELFHGKLDLSGSDSLMLGNTNDTSRKFFERIVSCKHEGEDRSDVIIPYAPVIEFYLEELHYFKDVAKSTQRLCLCGCGKPVFGQRKFASESCRKRLQRTSKLVEGSEKSEKSVSAENRLPAS